MNEFSRVFICFLPAILVAPLLIQAIVNDIKHERWMNENFPDRKR